MVKILAILALVALTADAAYARGRCRGHYYSYAPAPNSASVVATPAAPNQAQAARPSRSFSFDPNTVTANPAPGGAVYNNAPAYYGAGPGNTTNEFNYASPSSRYSYGQRPASSKANFNYAH